MPENDTGLGTSPDAEPVCYVFSPIALKGKPEVGNFTFALLGFPYVIKPI